MPPLAGFSDNPLRTRDDVVAATLALLRPLAACFSPGRGRVRLPAESAASFGEAPAQLEGFARPLWAVAALLAADQTDEHGLLQRWIDGLATGTDPTHPDYWGPMGATDQRMVEAEIVGFALLAAPDALYARQSAAVQGRIAAWLRTINGREMPANNWRWFRVFANLALVNVCGDAAAAHQAEIDGDLAMLDSFYQRDGWYSDGPWQTDEAADADAAADAAAPDRRRDDRAVRRQMDYYAGSFAIQFSQLLYCRFAGPLLLDRTRADRYRDHARQFAAQFWRYFDAAGAAIPYGRSLTYRFACGAFWAAVAVAGVDGLPAPLSAPGAAKGFLLRHLRWWAAHSDAIFYADGTLNIGYLYPNMYMCENYNSPQSVYWCLKTLIVVLLPADHAFWTAPEAPYPDAAAHAQPLLAAAPRQILCDHPAGRHHFLLNATQYVTWPIKSAEAKYAKFAYSSAFAFAASTGARVEQRVPDNALLLSCDAGASWAAKHTSREPVFSTVAVGGDPQEHLHVASVVWHPWPDRAVVVRTTLVPPADAWPDWHVRVHRITLLAPLTAALHLVEGGFAGPGRRQSDGEDLPRLAAVLPDGVRAGQAEGVVVTDSDSDGAAVLLLSRAGATGLAVDPPRGPAGARLRVTCEPLLPDANTSLYFSRSLVPVANTTVVGGLVAGAEIVLVTKVFAVAAPAGRSGPDNLDVGQRWARRPTVFLTDEAAKGARGPFIVVP